MAFSYTEQTGDCVTTVFPFTFAGAGIGYIRESDIVVLVNGVETTDFTFSGSNQIQFNSAPPAPSVAGVPNIMIRRVVPKDRPYADFSRGNNFGQDQMNYTVLQQLYALHEFLDGFLPDGYFVKGNMDFKGNRIINLGDPVGEQDAVTYSKLLTLSGRVEELASGTSQARPWVDAGDYPDLAAANAAAVLSNRELVVSTLIAVPVAATLTASVRVVPGGGFDVAEALNINGPFVAGRFQVFFGLGSVQFGAGSVSYIKPQLWGASTAATPAVNTAAIQAAINSKVPVQIGARYNINDELVLKNGTVLRGLNPREDKRSISKVLGLSALIQTAANKSVLVTDQTDLITTYVWGIKVSDITLVGQSSAGYSGLYLKSAAQSAVDNVSVYDCDYGIRISDGMLNTFNGCTLVGNSALTASIYIDEFTGTTTTQTFNDCYMRGSQWAYLNKSATNIFTTNTTFNDCTMETTAVGGAYIGKSCSATFVNLYAENVPSDSITTTGSIFSLGLAGWDGAITNGYLRIIGGHISGGNLALYTNSAIFRVGSFWSIAVDSAYLAAATKLLDTASLTSFPVGGLSLNNVEAAYLSATTTIDAQVSGSKYITGSYLMNSTGNVRHKFTRMDRQSTNVNITDYIKLTGSGSQLTVPVGNNVDLNVKHRVRIRGFEGANNVNPANPFHVEFSVCSLNGPALASLSSWGKSTNIGSVAVSGMSVVITFDASITNPQFSVEVISDNAALIDLTAITLGGATTAAGSGYVGEYLSSTRATGSASAMTTATALNVTTLDLPPGDWDVTGLTDFILTGATSTQLKSSLSLNSTVLGAQGTVADNPIPTTLLTGNLGQVLPTVRFSVSVTTTVYLVAHAAFSAGSVSVAGVLRARRALES